MNNSLDDLRGVPKGWAHGPPRSKIFKTLFYFFYFSPIFKIKWSKSEEKITSWCRYFFLMKILGRPLDELAPTGKNPWRRPRQRCTQGGLWGLKPPPLWRVTFCLFFFCKLGPSKISESNPVNFRFWRFATLGPLKFWPPGGRFLCKKNKMGP